MLGKFIGTDTQNKMLENIEKEIIEGIKSPHRAADLRVELSGLYSRLAGRLEEVLRHKAKVWGEIRESMKSDTSAERKWQSTELGLEETLCELRMKRIDKLSSSLSSLLKVFEGEANNRY